MRQLRVAAGMTQTDLAADRFSKEYVSQIERGKTRPTSETIEWLARRLDVDPAFLERGVSYDDRARVEVSLAQADALIESNRYDDALAGLASARDAIAATGSPDLKLRALSAEARARVHLGEVKEAAELLTTARSLVERPEFDDLDRADIVFQLGVCRTKLESITTAIALFDEALRLAEGSSAPSDRLRSNIFYWRSRAYRQQRDYLAAREDVERALELAEAASDERTLAHTYFQASLVAERQGHWVQARAYAERAKTRYENVADRESLARLLNNLGGLSFLLGKPSTAVEYLKEAVRVALELDSAAEAGQAVSSLAQVHLRTGHFELAEQQARRALELLDGRADFLHEIGSAQLVLGRAVLEAGRLDEAETHLYAAESTFEQLSSVSHRANAWMAQGELAVRRGQHVTATRLYCKAAEALQDVRF
ncbi:MAG: tetratricopeptide repeat protein [Actinobacteria bacterium]|nr:tetratricopeptide repeat protein [Actinomycetota bacterium]